MSYTLRITQILINPYSSTNLFTLTLCHHYPGISVINSWDPPYISHTLLFQSQHVRRTTMTPLPSKFCHYILGCHIHFSLPTLLCLPLLLFSFADFLTTILPSHHNSPNPYPNYSNFNFTPIVSQIHITPFSHPTFPIHKIFPIPSILPNPDLNFLVSHLFTNTN